MEEIKHAKIDELIQDDKNFNLGTEKGKELITKSLDQFGAGRSILIDKNNRIIAGNKTHENAKELGMDDVIVVETDGTKLVAVKRTDVDLDSKQGREMALADNATVQVDLEWDTETMNDVAEDFGIDLDEWGVDDFSYTPQPYNPPQGIGLPPELDGVDVTPDELPKLSGDDETLMERVIIVYPKEEEKTLAKILGLETIEKVVYNLNELKHD